MSSTGTPRTRTKSPGRSNNASTQKKGDEGATNAVQFPINIFDICKNIHKNEDKVDKLMVTATLRDANREEKKLLNMRDAPKEYTIAKLPIHEAILKNRKPLFVRPRIFIQMINNVESQTFGANLFVSATDADHNQTSSTAAFQARYENEEANKLLNPERLPPWHVNLLNAEKSTNLYKEKNLPTIRYFERGSLEGLDGKKREKGLIPAHFFERQQVSGTFKSEFHLQSFPFDKQILKIEMSLDCPIYIAQFDKLWLAVNRSVIDVDKACESALQMTEWEAKPEELFYKLDKYTDFQRIGALNKIMPSKGTSNKVETESNNDLKMLNYSRITVVIPINRISTHYLYIVFVPLLLINLTSIFAFSNLNPVDSLTFVGTLLLSVFSLKLAISNLIPKLSYLSTMDKIFVFSYGYLFLSSLIITLRSESAYIKTMFKIFLWVKFKSNVLVYVLRFIIALLSVGAGYFDIFSWIFGSSSKPHLLGVLLVLFDINYNFIRRFVVWLDFPACLVNGIKGVFFGLENILKNDWFMYLNVFAFLLVVYDSISKSNKSGKWTIKSRFESIKKWICEQTKRLVYLHFHDFFSHLNDLSGLLIYFIFAASVKFYPVIIDSLKHVFLFVFSFQTLLPMIFYCVTGLFRERFDPNEADDIVLNLNAYDKKPKEKNFFGYTVTGLTKFIVALLSRLYRHHKIEIIIVFIFITLLDFFFLYPSESGAIQTGEKQFQLKFVVCDFMISGKLLELMQKSYNSTLESSTSTFHHHEKMYSQTCVNPNDSSSCRYSIPIKFNISNYIFAGEGDEEVYYDNFRADHEGICNFLHLYEVLRCIAYIIFMSLWHIYRDCQEHRAAFESELQIYRDGAKKELDDIFKAEDEEVSPQPTPPLAEYYADREKPWTPKGTEANFVSRLIYRTGSYGQNWDTSYDPTSS